MNDLYAIHIVNGWGRKLTRDQALWTLFLDNESLRLCVTLSGLLLVDLEVEARKWQHVAVTMDSTSCNWQLLSLSLSVFPCRALSLVLSPCLSSSMRSSQSESSSLLTRP
jgi:hypothetical protein